MFLLFLMGLGAASVKAQVRIGGDTVPNAAAVLDLNANDTNTGTKGLALPRVDLTSVAMQLTSGTANLTGMLVYNTTATLGTGIYYWNGVQWLKLLVTSTGTAALLQLVLDTIIAVNVPVIPNSVVYPAPIIAWPSLCVGNASVFIISQAAGLRMYALSTLAANYPLHVLCYRLI